MTELNQTSCLKLIGLWRDRARLMADKHYRAAHHAQTRGGLLTLFNATAAITVLALANTGEWSYCDCVVLSNRFILPFASFCVVVSTLMQYLLRYDLRSSDHEKLAHRLSNFARKMERYIVEGQFQAGAIHNLSRRFSDITQSSIIIPGDIYVADKESEAQLKNHILELESELFGITFEGASTKGIETKVQVNFRRSAAKYICIGLLMCIPIISFFCFYAK